MILYKLFHFIFRVPFSFSKYKMFSFQLDFKYIIFLSCTIREDTHKKKCFFSGRTTKKNHFFSINGEKSGMDH